MNPEFDEVLLTAYLDEEVTDAEREAVEEQLRNSESSRKLLEELRSVRNLVMQLHQAQPSRSFQSGPWNASPSSGDSVKVILDESSRKWSWSYQKLASIAAVIAIAICSSVLIIRPNGMFVSRSENMSTDAGFELQIQAVPQPTDQPLSPGKADSSGSVLFSNEFDYLPKPGASPTGGGLASSDAAVATSVDNAPVGRGSAGAGQSAPGGFGAAPARAQAKSSMPKKQAEEIENIPLGETLFKSLFVVSPDDEVDWIALNPHPSNDSAGTAAPQSLGRSLPVDSIASYSYRFQRAAEKEGVADKTEKQLESQPIEFFTQSVAGAKDTQVPLPLLIEFQIPQEDWGAGAKRLRELGIGVPMVLPSLDYVDFNVTQAPTMKGTAELSAKAGAVKDSQASQWEFRRVEPQKSKMASELKRTTSDVNAPPAAGEGFAEAPSVFRIRVRAIKPE